jgi:hypothetical protein
MQVCFVRGLGSPCSQAGCLAHKVPVSSRMPRDSRESAWTHMEANGSELESRKPWSCQAHRQGLRHGPKLPGGKQGGLGIASQPATGRDMELRDSNSVRGESRTKFRREFCWLQPAFVVPSGPQPLGSEAQSGAGSVRPAALQAMVAPPVGRFQVGHLFSCSRPARRVTPALCPRASTSKARCCGNSLPTGLWCASLHAWAPCHCGIICTHVRAPCETHCSACWRIFCSLAPCQCAQVGKIQHKHSSHFCQAWVSVLPTLRWSF